MRVILNTLPEPTDQVIQNLTLGEFPLGPAFEAWQESGVNWQGEMCLQGEWVTSRMPEIPVPRAMIGWNPYFAQASSIGPMAIQGGAVIMVPIGAPKPTPIQIDPAIAALYSKVPQDATGELYGLGIMLPSPSAPALDMVLSAVPLEDPTPILNPRREIMDSGLLKVITSSNLPDNFGLAMIPLHADQVSYQVFTLTGTTRDELGVAVPNVRVIAYQSGTRYVDAGAKIIAETVSDGAGNFSMLLRNIDYQLVAYKEGAPDLGGLTRQDVTPVVTQTIYMRDPTVPSGGGGGGTFPVAGDVDAGVIYGPTNNLTGTLQQPAAGDVQTGVGYGAGGVEFTGTFAAPAVGDVDLGVGFGAGGVEFTGTLVQPAPTDVEAGVGYGAAGTEFTGTVTLPATTDVLTGVQYGAGGTEFTGSASGGGGGPNTVYTPRRSR